MVSRQNVDKEKDSLISNVVASVLVTVLSVQSADSLTVYEPVNKQIYSVVLANIDCPEVKQDYFTQSFLFVHGMLQNRKIGIQTRSHDAYKRPVVDVYFGSLYVNEYLVKMGYCWAYFSNKPEFREYEKRARDIGLGLWALPHPVAPWDFRRKK